MLSKRTINQIIKNQEKDILEEDLNFNKSIKYLKKNKIPYEEALGVIVEEQKSLKGLPLLLIKENLIENYEYMFKSVSINILIEIYKKEKDRIEIPSNYLINDSNYLFLTNKLLLIKNKDLLLKILNDNKEVLLTFIYEDVGEYDCEFLHYLDFLNFLNSKNKIYCKDLYLTILFELNFSKENIDFILYQNHKNVYNNLITKVVNNYDFDTFKQIVQKYGFDYEKSVPDLYSYYYIPIVPNIFFIDDRFNYNQNFDKMKISKQFLDLFIELNIPLFPKEILSQTKSNDIEMQKMFNEKNSCKGTISRSYYTTSKQIKENIKDENNDSSKNKMIELLKYYFSKTNTLEIDNSFWTLTLVSNKELNHMLLNLNKNNKKVWSYEEIRNSLKNAIYSNKPENVHDFLKDNKENLEMLYIKNNFGKTMLIDILQETERGIEKDKLLELCKNLLDYGYRINNHCGNKDFYEFFTFKNIGIQEELKDLCKKYPNNIKEFVCFEIDKPYASLNSFKQIEDITQSLLKVLKAFEFKNIDKIYFDKVLNEEIIYFSLNTKQNILFNINLLNGSELKKENIKIF